jgi:hypothetical protein
VLVTGVCRGIVKIAAWLELILGRFNL